MQINSFTPPLLPITEQRLSMDNALEPRAVYHLKDEQKFFKPGETNARLTILCMDLCDAIGIGDVIPRSSLSKRNVIAPEDQNANFISITAGENLTALLDLNSLNPVNRTKGQVYAPIDGEEVEIELEDGGSAYIEVGDDAEDPKTYYIVNHDGKEYLISRDNLIQIDDNDKEYVYRGGKRYRLFRIEVDGKTKLTVVGIGIPGLLQEAVDPIFTRFENKKNPIDLRTDSPENQDFFEHISPKKFIHCFLAMILFRTRDGRASVLDDSNVLFKKDTDGTLLPYLIDFDIKEVLPKATETLRCDLMGYPQALQPLNQDDQKETIDCLKKILAQKKNLLLLVKDGLSEERAQGLNQVIDKLEQFLKAKPAIWSLKDLLFFVYPSYRQTWERLDKSEGMTPIKLANAVGSKIEDSDSDISESDSDVDATEVDASDSEVDEADEHSEIEDMAAAGSSPSANRRSYASLPAPDSDNDELDDDLYGQSSPIHKAKTPASPRGKFLDSDTGSDSD